MSEIRADGWRCDQDKSLYETGLYIGRMSGLGIASSIIERMSSKEDMLQEIKYAREDNLKGRL